MTNDEMRNKFNAWFEFNNQPNLKLIAADASIPYPSLISWRNHKREFGQQTLNNLRKYFNKLEDRQKGNLELIQIAAS